MFIRNGLVGAIFLTCLLPLAALADSYRIGPGDVLQLRVLEWQPLDNRTLEWEAMRGELAVDADGMVSVPFLGRIMAAALSPAELSARVTDGLQQRLAVSASLDAMIQVVTYRPVYVSGAVRSPGEYRFRPGLTAAQLVAQAGGGALAQGAEAIDLRAIIGREGNLMLLNLEGERLAVRRAMLQAAIDGRERLELQPRPDGAAWPANVVASENEVLRLRRERRARELEALDNQIILLQNEIEALNGRAEALEMLVNSARREYASVQELAGRGLAAAARVAETERTLALVEAQLLDISTATLRARQGITLAEAEKIALRDRELVEDTRELQRIEGELERVLSTIDTQQRLSMAEAGLFLRDGTLGDDMALPEPIVTILRGQGDTAVRLTGLEVALEPGDVVTVAMPRTMTRWFDELRGMAIQ